MSRKKVTRDEKVLVLDPKYKDTVLTKFIRMLMWDGKLSVAEREVYSALGILEDKFKRPGLDVFREAIENVRPLLKVKARRVGGSTYQVPEEVSEAKGEIIAMMWIIKAARKKSGDSLHKRLSHELAEACEKRGDAYRTREDTHRMAEANRAFVHYRI